MSATDSQSAVARKARSDAAKVGIGAVTGVSLSLFTILKVGNILALPANQTPGYALVLFCLVALFTLFATGLTRSLDRSRAFLLISAVIIFGLIAVGGCYVIFANRPIKITEEFHPVIGDFNDPDVADPVKMEISRSSVSRDLLALKPYRGEQLEVKQGDNIDFTISGLDKLEEKYQRRLEASATYLRYLRHVCDQEPRNEVCLIFTEAPQDGSMK